MNASFTVPNWRVGQFFFKKKKVQGCNDTWKIHFCTRTLFFLKLTGVTHQIQLTLCSRLDLLHDFSSIIGSLTVFCSPPQNQGEAVIHLATLSPEVWTPWGHQSGYWQLKLNSWNAKYPFGTQWCERTPVKNVMSDNSKSCPSIYLQLSAFCN